MVERVFDCRMDSLLDISEWIHGECRSMRNVYRVTVRVEPLPERVKWPDAWSDVNRLELVPNKREPQYNVFVQFGDGNSTRAYFGSTYGAPFGIRDDDRHVTRIAENDNGYVKLSEVPDAK